jgi:hypothetical protein
MRSRTCVRAHVRALAGEVHRTCWTWSQLQHKCGPAQTMLLAVSRSETPDPQPRP